MNVDISPKRPPMSSCTAAAPAGSGSEGGGSSSCMRSLRLIAAVTSVVWVDSAYPAGWPANCKLLRLIRGAALLAEREGGGAEEGAALRGSLEEGADRARAHDRRPRGRAGDGALPRG